MTQIARYGKAAAREGHGEELAGHLLAAAAALADDPGCELYLINRQSDSPDTLWVTELWRSQADLDASLQQIDGSDEVAVVKALVEDFEIVELDLLGGKGPAAPPPPQAPAAHTIHRLTDTEDAAAKHGLGAFGEARFVSGDLGAAQTGVSHHRLRPGARQPFGHRHKRAEEVYVVLSGSGRVKLDDEIAPLEALDAVRVASCGGSRPVPMGSSCSPSAHTFAATGRSSTAGGPTTRREPRPRARSGRR